MNNIDSNTGEIVMYQPDETIRLEVRMGEETVWLSQAQMAELFGTKRQAITKHLQNIYESDELKKEATSSILELVRREGNRTVKRKVEFYNLDAIILKSGGGESSIGFYCLKKSQKNRLTRETFVFMITARKTRQRTQRNRRLHFGR